MNIQGEINELKIMLADHYSQRDLIDDDITKLRTAIAMLEKLKEKDNAEIHKEAESEES